MNLHTLTISCLQEIKPKPFKLEKENHNLVKPNELLTSLRNWLLPMLMNGQVKVSSTEATETKVSDVKEYEEKGELRVAAEGESPKYDKQ